MRRGKLRLSSMMSSLWEIQMGQEKPHQSKVENKLSWECHTRKLLLISKLLTTTWVCTGFAPDPTKYLLNIKVLTLVTICWSLHGHDHDTLVYVDSTYTGIPRISWGRQESTSSLRALRPYACFPNFDDFRLPQGDARASFSPGTCLPLNFVIEVGWNIII